MSLSQFAAKYQQFECPPAAEEGGAKPVQPQIVMVLDAKGCIQYCNDPAFFGFSEDELWGQSITGLISALPLRERTPGYNVAYVRFAFGHPAPQWLRKTAKVADGKMVPVDLFVRAVPVGRGYCLLAAIRPIQELPFKVVTLRKQPVSVRRPSLHLFAGAGGVMMDGVQPRKDEVAIG